MIYREYELFALSLILPALRKFRDELERGTALGNNKKMLRDFELHLMIRLFLSFIRAEST